MPYTDLVRRLAALTAEELAIIDREVAKLEAAREQAHDTARGEMFDERDVINVRARSYANYIAPPVGVIQLDEIDDAFDASDADQPIGPHLPDFDFGGEG